MNEEVKNFFIGKKIVIAGGGGFVGGHMFNAIKDVDCDIFIPRTADGIDFRKLDACFDYLNKIKPDIIINLAAFQGGIGFHEGKQGDMYLDNLLMGHFLMIASLKTGVEKFVNVIAGCSYPGYVEKDELNEDDYWNGEVHESIFSYGFSRKTTAVYGQALKRQHNFNSIHLVMANMFGPGEHFNPAQSKALAGLIKKFYEAKRENKHTVEIWGTGKPIRDWLYVKDGVEGILRAAALYNDISLLNIASGKGISITDLALTIKDVLGYNGELVYNTEKPDGALKKTFGVSKMQKELNWLPQISFHDAIKETIDWFDKNYEYAIKH